MTAICRHCGLSSDVWDRFGCLPHPAYVHTALRCELCGERFKDEPNSNDQAEMADPNLYDAPSVICHYGCGEAAGLAIA